VADVSYEAIEGDARGVICEAVDRHHAEILVIGCHGYSKWKRYGRSRLRFLVHLI